MNSIPISDKQLVKMIQQGGVQRQDALKHLYLDKDLKASLAKMCTALGKGLINLHDIRQDAFIAFDKNVRADKFKGESSIKTYIVTIAKYMVFNLLRKNKKEIHLDPTDLTAHEHPVETYNEVQADSRKKLVSELMRNATAQCQEILSLYIVKTPMKEIAQIMGYTQEQSAKNALYRCRKKLRKWLEESSLK